MKNFHMEFPRVVNRIPFVALYNGELEVGLGRYSILVGKWFVAFNGV